MADFNLPNFSINLDTVNTDILELLKVIKPDWTINEIEIKTLSGGASGCTSCAIFQDNKHDAVTIKVRKLFANEDNPLSDRDLEISVIQLAEKHGIFPKIHAVFQNGYCYQYIRGTPIANNDPSSSNSSFKSIEKVEDFPFKLMATTLAKLHCIMVDGKDYSKCEAFSKLLKHFEIKYPTKSNPYIVEKDVLRKEYTELLSYISKLNLDIVQCHGDLNMGNIIWNQKENSLTLVDWEGTHIGYQAYDVANFLLSLNVSKYFGAYPGMPVYNEETEQQLRKNFITLYLGEYFRLSKQCGKVPEDYLEKFIRDVNFCSLIWLLILQIFAGLLFEKFDKSENWDNFGLGESKIFQHYTSIKDDILRDLQLK